MYVKAKTKKRATLPPKINWTGNQNTAVEIKVPDFPVIMFDFLPLLHQVTECSDQSQQQTLNLPICFFCVEWRLPILQDKPELPKFLFPQEAWHGNHAKDGRSKGFLWAKGVSFSDLIIRACGLSWSMVYGWKGVLTPWRPWDQRAHHPWLHPNSVPYQKWVWHNVYLRVMLASISKWKSRHDCLSFRR